MIESIVTNPITTLTVWGVVGLIGTILASAWIQLSGDDRFKTVPIWVGLSILILLGPVVWISALVGIVSVAVSLTHPYR